MRTCCVNTSWFIQSRHTYVLLAIDTYAWNKFMLHWQRLLVIIVFESKEELRVQGVLIAKSMNFFGPIFSRIFIKHSWTHLYIYLIWDSRILKVLVNLSYTLESPIFQLAFLLTLKLSPSTILKLLFEFQDKQRVYKIHESVSNVCIIGEINGQVNEIVLSFIILIDFI